MATITTNPNQTLDTPVGVGGKIDTRTGQILSGQMQGQTASASPYYSTPKSSTIRTDQLGTEPINLPPPPPPSTPVNYNVSPPQGATFGADGMATYEQQKQQETQGSGLLRQIKDSIGALEGKGEATRKAQEEEQLFQKRTQAAQDYNAYQKMKLEQAQTLERMRTENPTGAYGEGAANMIREYQYKSDAQLANLAIRANASQGLLDAAKQNVTDKVDAQFKPIQDRIDNLSNFYQRYQSDLTEKQKIMLQARITQSTNDANALREVADKLHTNVLENGGGSSTLSALDRVTQDYRSGKIDAATAQSRYYQAAGQYGVDAKRRWEIAKLQSEVNENDDTVYSAQPQMSFEEYVRQAETSMQASIVPGTPLHDQLRKQYNEQISGLSQTATMASNLRALVAKTGPAAEIFDSALTNASAQGKDATDKFLRSQYINNVLSGAERENYNNVQNGIEMYKEAISYLEANPDMKTGFWKETAEGLKPKVGVPNDPRYATFLSLVNLAEGPIRKAQYGTALTSTELSLALRSMLNTDQDRETTLLKMRQAATAYENGIQKNMSNALGTTYIPKELPVGANTSISEGEDVYNKVLEETYSSTGSYNDDVNRGIGNLLNQLFVGI